MSQLAILMNKQKTLVTVPAITAMTGVNALIQCTCTAHGLETGDMVQISGVASPAGAANGQWVITKVDANNFTLNNSLGSGTWASGGAVAHIGFATAGLKVDNTVFTSVPDFTLQARLEQLSAGNARIIFEDAADSAFVTAQPLTGFQSVSVIGTALPGVYGGLAGQNDKMFTAKKYDVPSARMAASGDYVRVKVFMDGAVGTTAQFSTWLTY